MSAASAPELVVVIIEDDPAVRDSLELVLGNGGYAVAAVSSGEDARAGIAPAMNQVTASGGTARAASVAPPCQRWRCSATTTMLPVAPRIMNAGNAISFWMFGRFG